MKKLIYALRFMTILPIPWKENEDMGQVSRSSGMFPAVGFIIGTLLGLAGFAFSHVFSNDITAFLQTILWVSLTGGLHLDGLSDTFDGIGSGRDRKRMLEIMKDSSVGAFGALSLILQILWKYLFIREINGILPWLIIIPPITGRWGQLIAIYFFPSARKDGMGRFFKDYIRINEMLTGGVFTLLVYCMLMPFSYLALLPIHGVIIVLLSRGITRKIGGLSGDVYGLVCEIGESATLVLSLLYLNLFSTASSFQGLNQFIHFLFQ